MNDDKVDNKSDDDADLNEPVIDTIGDCCITLADGYQLSYLDLIDILKELSNVNLLRSTRPSRIGRPVKLVSAALNAAAEAVDQHFIGGSD